MHKTSSSKHELPGHDSRQWQSERPGGASRPGNTDISNDILKYSRQWQSERPGGASRPGNTDINRNILNNSGQWQAERPGGDHWTSEEWSGFREKLM